MTDETDQREVIAFLARELPVADGVASAAGAADPGCVEPRRIDTHGAIVFLRGDLVLKLKRAVDLGYFDFTTIGKRRAACQAEWELNRRAAPDIYLGLRAVVRGAGGALALVEGKDAGAAGEVLDWVVAMRRFPQDALLARVAARGELTAPLLLTLADGIARFHLAAPPCPSGDGAGRVRAVLEGNRAAMARLASGTLPEDRAELLLERSLAMLERLSPLLDRRAAAGHVRHGHGDLHLGNICLWQGVPTLFDCLEFDAGLATCDVLYDLAFLLMDLWQRGLRAEASLVMNRYLDLSDEDDGLPALPLFLSMRAAVRAHVAGAAAASLPDEGARAAKSGEALKLLAAALEFLNEPAPGLVAVGGLSGTGKSTLAGGLAPRLGVAPGARWLRSDVLRKRLAGVAPEQHLPKDAYTAQASARVYARIEEKARAVLAFGWPVVADAVFAGARERERIAAVATAAGAPFAGLWLEAPVNVAAQRVDARFGDASDADVRVVRAQQAYELGEIAPWHRIDAARAADVVLAEALALIAQPLNAAQGDHAMQDGAHPSAGGPGGARASLTTHSGLVLETRAVSPADGPLLAQFFGTVAPHDLRFRFLSAQSKIHPDQIEAMLAVDHDLSEHLLAFDAATGAMVASAMMAADPAREAAEVAISVAADRHEQGIGWTLLAHMAELARARGIRKLRSIESRANLAAIDVERMQGFTVEDYQGDETLALVEKRLD